MAKESPAKRLVAKAKKARSQHKERHRPTGFGIAIADAVDALSAPAWDAVVEGGTLFMQRPYLRMLEVTAPAGLRPRTALVFRGARPVAAVAAQLVTVSGSQLHALPGGEEAVERKTGEERADEGKGRKRRALKKALAPLRPVVEKVSAKALAQLEERVLVCGNLLTWGFHGVAFARDADRVETWPAIAEVLYRIRRADRLAGQTDFVMIKDVSESDADGIDALSRFSYAAFETEPDMVLDLSGIASYDEYLARLTARYRKSTRNMLKDSDAARLVVEPVTDVAARADRIHELYMAVHSRAKVRLLTLTRDYLPALAEVAGDAFRCTCIRRDDEILGFVTTLRDGDTGIGYFIGFDSAANREAPLYFRLLQAVVADAIALGCRRISLGRTALDPKARLGAKPQPQRVWIRHRVPFLNAIVRRLLAGVHHDEAPERGALKSDDA